MSPLSHVLGTLPPVMRHTTFRFALAPTPSQGALLARHAGASRFAYNQCLRLLTETLEARRTNPQIRVPWSRFDLINAVNAWKRSEAAGRIFVVAPDGTVTKRITGLSWRHEVSAQVFEEAAVDLGRALLPTRRLETVTARAESASRDESARATAGTASGYATKPTASG